MKNSFNINLHQSMIVKIYADELTQKIFEDYFNCKFNENYPDEDIDYVINYCGIIKEKVDIPTNSMPVHAFLGAKYYIWKRGNKFCAYAQDGQLKGNHYCERIGNQINVYVGDSDSRDIVFRIYRELMFRNLLSSGYVPMHATASVDQNNLASVFFGCRNAGKTIMLCSHIHNLKENPLATDVIMLKYNRGHLYCCGIPIKFSYDAKMLELFNFNKLSVNQTDRSKNRICNKKFNILFHCHSVWDVKEIKSFQNILFIKDSELVFDNDLIKPLTYEEYMDKWNFGDFLQLMPNFEIDLESTYKYIRYTIIRGDFAKYVK